MPTRKEVYAAIDTERDYQRSLWGDPESQGGDTHLEYLAYMRSYINEAIEELCRRHEAQSRVFAVNAFRKVAALAVAAMEIHGAPHRRMSDLAQSCELHSVKCDE